MKLCCFKSLFEEHFCLNNRPFFITDKCFDFGSHSNKNLKSSKIPLLSFHILKNFKQIKQKTPEILHLPFFIIFLDCVCDIIFM